MEGAWHGIHPGAYRHHKVIAVNVHGSELGLVGATKKLTFIALIAVVRYSSSSFKQSRSIEQLKWYKNSPSTLVAVEYSNVVHILDTRSKNSASKITTPNTNFFVAVNPMRIILLFRIQRISQYHRRSQITRAGNE